MPLSGDPRRRLGPLPFAVADRVDADDRQPGRSGVLATELNKARAVLALTSAMTKKKQSRTSLGFVEPRGDAADLNSFLSHQFRR